MKLNKTLGDLLHRQFSAQTKKIPPFKIDRPAQHVLDYLMGQYIYNVTRRGMVVEMDDSTAANLEAVAAALVAGDAKRGIWLYGTVGNGKTTMLYSISQTISFFKGAFGHMGQYFDPRPVFYTASQICDIFRDKDDRIEEWRLLMKCDILCIDDIGTEPKEIQVFGNILTPVMDVLSERYRLQKVTFITSNLAPNQIGAKYDERIADRCRETFVPIKFLAATYRKR